MHVKIVGRHLIPLLKPLSRSGRRRSCSPWRLNVWHERSIWSDTCKLNQFVRGLKKRVEKPRWNMLSYCLVASSACCGCHLTSVRQASAKQLAQLISPCRAPWASRASRAPRSLFSWPWSYRAFTPTSMSADFGSTPSFPSAPVGPKPWRDCA